MVAEPGLPLFNTTSIWRGGASFGLSMPTTCALVMINPLESSKKPEPLPSFPLPIVTLIKRVACLIRFKQFGEKAAVTQKGAGP